MQARWRRSRWLVFLGVFGLASLLSGLRGHDDIGVGTLIGSKLFNGLAIVGVAGLIHPIAVPRAEVALTLALYAGFVWGSLQ